MLAPAAALLKKVGFLHQLLAHCLLCYREVQHTQPSAETSKALLVFERFVHTLPDMVHKYYGSV